MKSLKYSILIVALCTLCQCQNSYFRIENKEEHCRCSESKLISLEIDDKIEDGFGMIYGYVITDGDTNSGILSAVAEPKLYLLDTDFKVDIDGLYELKLPIGKYKILVEANQRFPVISKIELKNKESIHINFYLNGGDF